MNDTDLPTKTDAPAPLSDDDKARLGMAWQKPRHGKDGGCGESRTPLSPDLEVSMSGRVTVTAEQLVAEYGWPESTAALFVPGGEEGY